MSPEPDPDALTADLGSDWVLRHNSLKPYASGVVTHPLIDVGRALRDDYLVAADDIATVKLLVHPLVVELTNIQQPTTGLESKFSVRHCFAAGFLDSGAGPDQFSDQRVLAPDIIALRDRVTVEDGGLPPMQAVAEVTLTSGKVIKIDMTKARGTMDRPLSLEEVDAKYFNLANAAIGEPAAKSIHNVVHEIESRPFTDLVKATGF